MGFPSFVELGHLLSTLVRKAGNCQSSPPSGDGDKWDEPHFQGGKQTSSRTAPSSSLSPGTQELIEESKLVARGAKPTQQRSRRPGAYVFSGRHRKRSQIASGG